jgi:hypothetical protein
MGLNFAVFVAHVRLAKKIMSYTSPMFDQKHVCNSILK